MSNNCKSCLYRWKVYSNQKIPYCGYSLDTGQFRNCPIEGCSCFVAGTPHRRRKPIFSPNYFGGGLT